MNVIVASNHCAHGVPSPEQEGVFDERHRGVESLRFSLEAESKPPEAPMKAYLGGGWRRRVSLQP
jgi:hypothetical protein